MCRSVASERRSKSKQRTNRRLSREKEGAPSSPRSPPIIFLRCRLGWSRAARSLPPRAKCPAIINETLAQEFWPNQDPIGRELRFGEQHTICTIVGMVKDIKMYQLRPRPERQMYVS